MCLCLLEIPSLTRPLLSPKPYLAIICPELTGRTHILHAIYPALRFAKPLSLHQSQRSAPKKEKRSHLCQVPAVLPFLKSRTSGQCVCGIFLPERHVNRPMSALLCFLDGGSKSVSLAIRDNRGGLIHVTKLVSVSLSLNVAKLLLRCLITPVI